jgi:hypothetical protein
MRRLTLIAAAVAALAVTTFAVAARLDGAPSARSLTGTFAATAGSTKTSTCTTTDGKTITVTHATYTGMAGGDPDLAGPIKLDARSVLNTTDAVGTVEGTLRIDVASGGDTTAHFAAVYDHGKLAGLATGHARDPHAKLVANLSADFSSSGFANGKLGASAGGSAVEVSNAKCKSTRQQNEKSRAVGTVSGLSSSAITVAGLTCSIPPSLASKTAALKVGDRAEIECTFTNAQNMLVKVSKR